MDDDEKKLESEMNELRRIARKAVARMRRQKVAFAAMAAVDFTIDASGTGNLVEDWSPI